MTHFNLVQIKLISQYSVSDSDILWESLLFVLWGQRMAEMLMISRRFLCHTLKVLRSV